ncbi:cytochrome c1 [Breoghania sp. L-A4]|uniref:cytochrome c1 n=1 Tax=Breoghania sp. L-A4 TaxID=2304600 RepID=UPI000E358A6C|nr:cytochrome c1 [Breoghania sp. L-A4]AXS41462.1 cytochrome c1 [Breoghania sp. L-A4]
MKTLIANAVRAAIAVAFVATAGTAFAAGGEKHIEKQDWSFAGPFGHYDKAQLQRGFQIYKEVCSGCHALSLVAFRNLGEEGGLGYSDEQIKALAAEYTVMDGPDDEGEMFERAAKASDRLPSPFPNEQAARASNSGAYPPDLSLIAKARAVERGFPWFVFDAFTQYQEQGVDYLYALLTGYHEAPEGVAVPEGQYYNPNFIAGHSLAMAPPLFDEGIEYSDGTPMTVDQYARDVASFLMWTAEPKLEQRKLMGFRVMVFLLIFASLLFFTKKKLWRNVEH